jgi:hypothetical protein
MPPSLTMISTAGELDSTGPFLMNEVNPIVEQTPLTLKQSCESLLASHYPNTNTASDSCLEADWQPMQRSDRLACLAKMLIQLLCTLEGLIKKHLGQASCL